MVTFSELIRTLDEFRSTFRQGSVSKAIQEGNRKAAPIEEKRVAAEREARAVSERTRLEKENRLAQTNREAEAKTREETKREEANRAEPTVAATPATSSTIVVPKIMEGLGVAVSTPSLANANPENKSAYPTDSQGRPLPIFTGTTQVTYISIAPPVRTVVYYQRSYSVPLSQPCYCPR